MTVQVPGDVVNEEGPDFCESLWQRALRSSRSSRLPSGDWIALATLDGLSVVRP